jgi:UDP-glucose 4-epimerase
VTHDDPTDSLPSQADGSARTALVTGASGFLGRQLVRTLRARGWRVSECLRDPRAELDAVALPDLDASSIARVPPHAWDVDAVFHLAGLAHRYPPHVPSDAEYMRVNAEGSRLLAQAARGRARTFVFAGSIAAVTSGGVGRAITPETEPKPTTAYGRSKLEAERLLRKTLERSATSLRILRFPAIYGLDAPGAIGQLARWTAAGRPVPSGARATRRSMIAVANAVDALVVAATHPALDGATAMPTDGPAPDVVAMARMVAEAQGRALRVAPCPAFVLRGLAAAARLAPGGGLPGLAALERLVGSCAIEDDTLARLAGWRAPLSQQDAIRATFGGRA